MISVRSFVIIGQPKIHRFQYLATAFISLLLMGLVYSWSLFADPIQQDFGWDSTQTSFIFTLSMIFMSIGMVVAGILEKHFSRRTLMVATGVLLGGGFIAAAFASNLLTMYVAYGAIASFGSGMGTDVVMATVLKWYPDKSSMASGGMLMGFGMGSFLLSPFVDMLLTTMGWRQTFILLGIAFIVIMVITAAIVHAPSSETERQLRQLVTAGSSKPVHNYRPAQMVGRPAFWYFFIWLILITSGGLALISQAVPAADAVLAVHPIGDAATMSLLATLAMGAVSLCNGFGRLLNGVVWERFGYRASVFGISIMFLASMLISGIAMQVNSYWLIVLGFVLLGLAYGGSMASMASMASEFFGPKHFAINYAISVLELIPSAFIGPMIISSVQQTTGSFITAFWIFLVFGVIGLGLAFIIREPRTPKEMRKAEYARERARKAQEIAVLTQQAALQFSSLHMADSGELYDPAQLRAYRELRKKLARAEYVAQTKPHSRKANVARYERQANQRFEEAAKKAQARAQRDQIRAMRADLQAQRAQLRFARANERAALTERTFRRYALKLARYDADAGTDSDVSAVDGVSTQA
ncbi:sugar phosphate permease [Bifidobacterium dolichotidis]|uniref:Sugar phosphate permease n=1 Tax=Bifidobacterium dolichotidis TaxID=2306976 RepID=A0A430FSX0_9BIFI|nr:MFS transporter [Bifidobacterium dolichotidis]RSX55955.1 sugar phosphate permease [Bifidobacterium dolichotidis]